jgi:ElaB/YqjD/DUF883 family membrane-anchored ribosome-binding protein
MAANRTDNRSPDEIERDIRHTQADMSRTVDELEHEMTGRNLFNTLLDKADENGVDARYLLDAARRNPLALGMIAIGGLWLVSDSDARPSAMKPSSNPFGGDHEHDDEGWHREHRAYVAHMARCERRPDEDDAAYRRRRDDARADYFMIERRHDEDESSHRKRLDEATDQLRQRRDQAAQRARELGRQSRERAGAAASQAQGFYEDNPLLGGLAAAFVGAVAGSALPATRTEEDYLGSTGEQALGEAEARAREAGEQARRKKDEMVDKADRRMDGDSGRQPQGTNAAGRYEAV